MTLNLVGSDDTILRTHCLRVTKPNIEVLPFISDMKWLMLRFCGAGVAAPQVGIPLRFFIMNGLPGGSVVINPTIIWCADLIRSEAEMCLSKPGFRSIIPRPTEIRARWEDEEGKFHSEKLTGFKARVFQHECDHLDGRLIF